MSAPGLCRLERQSLEFPTRSILSTSFTLNSISLLKMHNHLKTDITKNIKTKSKQEQDTI